jgi:hypothetical protein
MYKSVLTFALSAILFSSLIMGCKDTPKENLDEAVTDVVDASADLAKADSVYLAEVEAYKADAAVRIAENEAEVSEYNNNLKIKKTENLKEKIDELSKKTEALKQKMADYNSNEGKPNWNEFKLEVKRDMDEIINAKNDLKVRNNNR